MNNKITKIWALFCVYNEYNQPDNNLIAWWAEIPNKEKLCNVIDVILNEYTSKLCDDLLNGKEVRYEYTDYRLNFINEGKIIGDS